MEIVGILQYEAKHFYFLSCYRYNDNSQYIRLVNLEPHILNIYIIAQGNGAEESTFPLKQDRREQ